MPGARPRIVLPSHRVQHLLSVGAAGCMEPELEHALHRVPGLQAGDTLHCVNVCVHVCVRVLDFLCV